MKTIRKFFTYVLYMLVSPKKLSDAVNTVSSPEELDRVICGE